MLRWLLALLTSAGRPVRSAKFTPHPDTIGWGTAEEELRKFRARRHPKKEETDVTRKPSQKGPPDAQ